MPNIGSAPVSKNFQPGLIVQSSSALRTDPMVELYADPTTHRLLVDAALTIDSVTVSENIVSSVIPGFNIPVFDYIAVTTNSTSDIYVYKTGGSGGTTVCTITVIYSDTTKATITSVAKT